jgi:hypothetical protein
MAMVEEHRDALAKNRPDRRRQLFLGAGRRQLYTDSIEASIAAGFDKGK